MQFFTMIVRFFQGGGPMMYPIAVVLVVGAAIAIERYIVLTSTSIRNRGLWNEIAPLLTQGNFKGAVQVTSRSDAAIGQILSYGLARIGSARSRDDIEKAMEESLMDVVPRLEKRTHYLATFARSAGYRRRSDQCLRGGGDRQPGGQGQPAICQYFGGHELHGLRTDDRRAAAGDTCGAADQDHGAGGQPRDGVSEISECRDRAPPGRRGLKRPGPPNLILPCAVPRP